jgi:hypothetical protein
MEFGSYQRLTFGTILVYFPLYLRMQENFIRRYSHHRIVVFEFLCVLYKIDLILFTNLTKPSQSELYRLPCCLCLEGELSKFVIIMNMWIIRNSEDIVIYLQRDKYPNRLIPQENLVGASCQRSFFYYKASTSTRAGWCIDDDIFEKMVN